MTRWILLAVLSLPLLSACVPLLVGGAAAGAGHDRRSFRTVLDDQNIELTAYDQLNRDKQLTLANNVEVVVYNGVMLLLGEVPTAEMKQRAQDKVSNIAVKRIVNEIEIGPRPGVGQGATDKWLTGRVKTALLDIVDLPDFDPTRVNVTTENGSVYLMGLVSHEEAERVIAIARDVQGVKRVVNVFEYTDQG